MELMPVAAVQPVENFNDLYHRKRKFVPGRGVKKERRTDHKILDFALEKLTHSSFNSQLLATAEAPKIVSVLISEFFFQLPVKNKVIQLEKEVHDNKSIMRPIGIPFCEYNSWINALIQLIIFLPSLSEMFIYTTYTLSAFIDFIDQYKKDQKASKAVTSAKSSKLLEGLRKKFPHRHLKKARLFEVLDDLMKSVDSSENENENEFSDLLALHPSWRLQLVPSEKSFEKRVEERIKEQLFCQTSYFQAPSELLVGLEPDVEILLKKKFYLFNAQLAYELDAFIEYRPETADRGSYIVYLQIEHSWYQCDNTRIIQLRSINLPIVFKRAILFHYRRVV